MADKKKDQDGSNLPLYAMGILGALGGIVVAACFYVINYWPQPVSVVPYFGPETGFIWGAIVGAVNGLVLGFITDDSHFQQSGEY